MPSPRTTFARELARLLPEDGDGRRWLFVPYDQLTGEAGPLARERPDEVGIVMVECSAKAARRPYHKQKLALVLANMRHFALEQARRGVAVRYLRDERGYAPALRDAARELGALTVMEPAERELRVELQPLVDDGLLQVVPHEGWLTSRDTFLSSQKRKGGHAGPPYRMDAFYRAVRREHDVLMDDDGPLGGRFSFDGENRKPWKGDPLAPEPPAFPTDDMKEEVAALVEERFADHPGRIDLASLPATAQDAEDAWTWAKQQCLPTFGPYEDAMSRRSTGLFHTRLSPLMNLHRLLPARVVAEAEACDVPLASKEGFLRQVWGWREFMRHVHVETDGLRTGYAAAPETSDGPAAPAALGAGRPLPPAYWEGDSGLACLDQVVSEVWDTGYSHHITRLMVLSNLATLLDVSPRELTDWFWVAYVDAFDWVVEPNVLGMGTFAAGDLLSTKPYVSGAAYLDKMSDYCGACAFDPKKDCPLTRLYWAFLDRQQDALGSNPRMTMPFASLHKRSDVRSEEDRAVFEAVSEGLAAGSRLEPQSGSAVPRAVPRGAPAAASGSRTPG
jgi:deoxyribodipyrimidine photolyase-related protein